jgi:hypothetical protein
MKLCGDWRMSGQPAEEIPVGRVRLEKAAFGAGGAYQKRVSYRCKQSYETDRS